MTITRSDLEVLDIAYVHVSTALEAKARAATLWVCEGGDSDLKVLKEAEAHLKEKESALAELKRKMWDKADPF